MQVLKVKYQQISALEKVHNLFKLDRQVNLCV